MTRKKNKETCDGCPALCCKGLEEAVTKPRTEAQQESFLWQIQFVNTHYFIRNRRWYQLTLGACGYLDKNNRCTIYEDRPDICRDHNPPACEYHGSIYDTLFETREAMQAYFDAEKNRLRRRRAARKKAILP